MVTVGIGSARHDEYISSDTVFIFLLSRIKHRF